VIRFIRKISNYFCNTFVGGMSSLKNMQDFSQDSNLALMELEKGLRSVKSGEQYEVIVHLPTLLERYPFPLLVNSAFLKLADVFRTGSNFLKLCVLKAIQSSKHHLIKIFNIDEFCRRFFAVSHSNDPIARAVTLRVFGNIACIASERKNIHHCIRTSLDSNDMVEKEAAIFALKCFSEQSRCFVESIWLKVAKTVQNIETPIDIKLKLLPVFKYMSHDVHIATQVYTLCTKTLLSSFPAYPFVTSLLNITTQLTLSTLIDIPKQIDLLLQYCLHDPRKCIQLVATRNLHLIAKQAHHLWKSTQVTKLCESVPLIIQSILKENILRVIICLAESSHQLFTEQAQSYLDNLVNDVSLDVSTLALHAKVLIKSRLSEENMDMESADIQMLLAMSLAETNFQAYKRCLLTLKVLLYRNTENQCASLKSFLLECLTSFKDKYLLELCNTIASVSIRWSSFLSNDVDTLLTVIKKCLTDSESDNGKIGIVMATLIMHASTNKNVDEKIEIQLQLFEIIMKSELKCEYWTLYKVGRIATNLVCPNLAWKIFSEAQTKVSSEHYAFWLQALTKFQYGESLLLSNVQSIQELQTQLMSALNSYQEGLISLKAAITTNHPLYFQFKFARLRADTLKAYNQLLVCCSSFKLHPPPAMIMKNDLKDVQYQCRIASQFQTCANMFNNVTMGYQHLFHSSFNADSTSLQFIQVLIEASQVMAHAIELLISQRSTERISTGMEGLKTSSQPQDDFVKRLSETNLQLYKHIMKVDKENVDVPLSNIPVDCLSALTFAQLKVGLSYPYYFFNSQQKTSVQLSISPGSSTKESPCSVNITHNMALQIEGFILQNNRKANFRNVSKVNLRVKVMPSDQVTNPANQYKPVQACENILIESTQPHNDYFSSHFLLTFKYVGHHTIKITCGVTDEHGVDWETGPTYMLYADVFEHAGHYKKK